MRRPHPFPFDHSAVLRPTPLTASRPPRRRGPLATTLRLVLRLTATASVLLPPGLAAAEAGSPPVSSTDQAAGARAAAPPPLGLDPQVAPPAQSSPAGGAPSVPAPAPGASSSPPAAISRAPVSTAAALPPEWTRGLTIGGGTIIWYYQPFLPGVKNTIDLFFVNLLFDGQVGDFGLHIEPRFRDTKLRPHFGGTAGGTAWVQEVYASWKLPGATLKAGKAYSHFGLFWDNSFYGNVQVYDGLKLDPDFGLSLEGTVAPGHPFGARYWAQFFVVDGLTNVALDGRETFTIPGARRRNQAILRVEPFLQVRPGVGLKVGLSGEYLQADLPAPVGKKDVYRGAADVTVTAGPVSLWSELIRQNGQTVTAFPIAGAPASGATPAIPGQASAHTNYFLVGAELAIGKVSARYNLSYGGYRDLSISEWMHVPGLGVAVSPNVTFLGEFVYWKRYAPTGDVLVDKSFNLTLQAHF